MIVDDSWGESTIIDYHAPFDQGLKLPILKWSKHGAKTISLPDFKYVVGEVFALWCGDIHPHPGPRSTLKSPVNGTRTQANKCSTTQDSRNQNHYLTVAHLNVRSMASRENFHLIEQIVVNYAIFTISGNLVASFSLRF